MICSRLDRQMREMAKNHRCTYTRYADDMTVSTNLIRFPTVIASVLPVGGDLRCAVGQSLLDVVTSNGFSINEKKLRLQPRRQRQEVTGLTTNVFPNVPRQYVRQIRAMLHACRKYALEDAPSESLTK